MFRRLLSREQGDTIVEVLIALAILTFVLGGAYYSANQSLRNDRDSQEHTEALTIAQSQLEDLRAFAQTSAYVPTAGPTQTFSAINDQCLNITGGSLSATSGCLVANNTNGNSTLSSCPGTAAYCYTVKITQTNSFASPLVSSVTLYTYNVVVSWPALGGGNDQVNLYYRVDNS